MDDKCITNNGHDVTMTTHARKRHILISMTTVNNLRNSSANIFNLNYSFVGK